MGNGPRVITIDIETKPLQQSDIEDAAAKAVANFGRPSMILLPPAAFRPIFMGSFSYEVNAEYRGTPWAETSRMTKRERAVAGLHTTLKKLGALKKISPEDFEVIKNKSIKRLKRAKWARYQQKKQKKV